jgi:L-fucose mutarotase
MLKGIHALLTADLLHALAAMGHGDTIALVDANFPAASNARRLLHVAGATAPEVLAAVLTVLPLDSGAEPAAITMAPIDPEIGIPEAVADFAAAFTACDLADLEIASVPREAFYARTREAFAVVLTGERRAYGNILLVKGVIADADVTAPRPDR